MPPPLGTNKSIVETGLAPSPSALQVQFAGQLPLGRRQAECPEILGALGQTAEIQARSQRKAGENCCAQPAMDWCNRDSQPPISTAYVSRVQAACNGCV